MKTAARPGPDLTAVRRKRVLIVEDDEDVTALLTEYLESAGYAVLTADGATGLASIASDPPDLILLDMVMPGVDGFEFLARIHDVSDGRIPVLIVSGLGDVLVAAMRSGVGSIPLARGVVPKPFDMADLLARVGEITGARS